jgi:hypothetical protein
MIPNIWSLITKELLGRFQGFGFERGWASSALYSHFTLCTLGIHTKRFEVYLVIYVDYTCASG